MKKLTVNCGSAMVLKYNHQLFDEYEEIDINAGSFIISGEAYRLLSKKKLVINSGVQKILDDASKFFHLGENVILKEARDYSGCFLLAEKLEIMPNALKGLTGVDSILAETIYCPESVSLEVQNSMEAEEIIMYPDDAYLVSEDTELDMNLVQNCIGKSQKMFAACCINAFDSDAISALRDNGISLSCKTLRIHSEYYENNSDIFTAEKLVVIPEGYRAVNKTESLRRLLTLYGDKLYILGDLHIKPMDADVLLQMQGIVAEGTVKLPSELLPGFRKIGKAAEVFPYEGILVEITGKGTLSHGQFETAKELGEGYTIIVNGFVEIEDDVTAEDMEYIYSFNYNGMVKCPKKLQPLLKSRMDTENGIMTDERLESNDREDCNNINLGLWMVK